MIHHHCLPNLQQEAISLDCVPDIPAAEFVTLLGWAALSRVLVGGFKNLMRHAKSDTIEIDSISSSKSV